MIQISQPEKELIQIYKKLRIKEIKNFDKLKQELTLTEQVVLFQENQEIEKQIKKIRDHVSDLFYQRWLKQWDEMNNFF